MRTHGVAAAGLKVPKERVLDTANVQTANDAGDYTANVSTKDPLDIAEELSNNNKVSYNYCLYLNLYRQMHSRPWIKASALCKHS